jgi:carboxypeptidase D
MPVGTGWSYGEKANTSLEEVGTDFLTFLLNFYSEHPQYRNREIILTGESFGGKYLSFMSKSILDFNSKNPTK